MADFAGETASGLRVADAAVIVVSAAGGVEVGTELLWREVRARNLPAIVFVSKMDREHADYDAVLAQVRARLGSRCAAVNLPVGAEASFSGIVDLLGGDIPPERQAAAEEARDQLAEAVAETDDDLTLKFLDEGSLSAEQIAEGLANGVRTGAVVPVLAGSSTASAGVEQVLDAIVSFFPSPADVGAVKATKGGAEVELAPDPAGPLAALVFKTSADPFVGKLSYFRVYSGTFESNHEVWDAGTEQSERVAQAHVPIGKTQENVHALVAGDIGSAAKLTHAVTGDTLTTKADGISLARMEFPPAVYSVAVHPKSSADLDKLSASLHRLLEEDPSLHLRRDPATAEMIVTGLGDTHVDVLAERAKRKFGVDIDLSAPRVPYRETISRVANVEHKHKKQSGGHGQYGHVVMRLEPMPRGGGFEFASEVVGGSVPKEYVQAVEKGVHKTMEDGAVAGYPVVDVKVVLTGGSSHAVDSSGQSFEIAASMAMKKGVQDATPVLLEPVMHVTINAPEQFAGTIVGDINTRRGHIRGMNPDGGIATIEAEVPQAEAQQYSNHLRALTQGRGTMSLAFDHYGQVPAHLTQKIVEGSGQELVHA